MESYKGILGVIFLIGICYLLSKDRKSINWRLVSIGIGLQLVFAVLVLRVPIVKKVFEVIASVFVFLQFKFYQQSSFFQHLLPYYIIWGYYKK